MENVWLLQHVHEWDDGHEDIKLIGVFSTESDAKSALETVRDQPGFRDLRDGFCISEKHSGLLAGPKVTSRCSRERSPSERGFVFVMSAFDPNCFRIPVSHQHFDAWRCG